MLYTENIQKNIRGISISRKGERVFHGKLSLDTHVGAREPKTEAIGLVYVKALLSGAKGYGRKEFLDAINLIGADISIGIDRGIVSISLTSTDKHMSKLLKLTEVMITAPTFDPKEIRRIITLLENELTEEKEDAKTQSLYLLIDNIYAEKDRRSVSKTDDVIKQVKKVNRKDLLAFHKRATQSKWLYTFSCDEAYAKKVQSFFGKLRNTFKEAKSEYAGEFIKKISKRKVELLSIPSKQNIEINFGNVVPLHIKDKEYFAFLFGLNVLGKWGGFAGRLMSTVREKEGLTYGIYARVETASLTEQGYWRIMTFFAPDKVMQGISSTLREIDVIRKTGITESEYVRFKNIIKTSEALLQDSIASTVSYFHGSQQKGLSLEEIGNYRKEMLDVTIDDVNAALKKYLDPESLIIAAAGPITKNAKELKALERVAKTTK
jgi:zinc protease